VNDIERLERRVAELEARLQGETPKYVPGDKVLVELTIESGPDSQGEYIVTTPIYRSTFWVNSNHIKGRA
jgi:hypothetical protein